MPPIHPELRIDGRALQSNWTRLNALSSGKAGAVVKANGYGLGVENVAPLLWNAGARDYFVASFDEGVELRTLLPEARIFELSGLSIFTQNDANLIPVLNSMAMVRALDDRPFALQFDTGMTRLGIGMNSLAEVQHLRPDLVISHLASADNPASKMNSSQLAAFSQVRETFPCAPASLSATGGILLGQDFQFDLIRPGIGIYGGEPYSEAEPTIQIAAPVIQSMEIQSRTSIGYSETFISERPMRVATLFGGYADGIARVLSNQINFYHNETPCPVLGRISMDAITVDISALDEVPTHLELFRPEQSINHLASKANTIAYELFTSLGSRYKRFII